MTDTNTLASFKDSLDNLETTLTSASSVTGAFDKELGKMLRALTATGNETQKLSRSLSTNFKKVFDDLLFGGTSMSSAFDKLRQSLINTAYSTAVKPIQNALQETLAKGAGQLVAGMVPFQKGAGFAAGHVIPFATGGIVNRPVMFPLGKAHGLMGEAGPEAILPLARSPDGSLGVRAESTQKTRPVYITMNITTENADSFQRSQSQIAAGLSRALSRGQRNH